MGRWPMSKKRMVIFRPRKITIPWAYCWQILLLAGNEEPPHVGDNADIDRDTARGTVGVDIDAILSDCSSQPEFPDPHDREGRRSGLDIPPTEKILTRLYEGHCFGEMALIYDEPRNASVRATTYTTCVYLHKDAFRKHLGDKTFNKLIEQAALKTAFFREQREMVTEHHNKDSLLATAAKDESWKCFTSARALATVQGSARSSFRCTEQLKFAGDTKGETRGRLVNDYRVCEKVGEGSFGAVYKVVHVHSGEINAMKVITKPRRGGQKRELLERSLRREISVMQMLRHPNVVTLFEVIDDPRSRKVYMIQEFMAGGSLLKEKYAVEPIPEQIALTKFVQAARGVQYIHSFGICHGDIKPSNILGNAEGRVKIADFGACVILNPEDVGGDGDISSSGTSVESPSDAWRDRDRRRHRRKKRGQRVGGTPTFHPPELFGEDGVSRISFASDVWALGITLYQMVVGKMPFFGRSYRALMASIQMEELSFPSDCQIDPYLANLLHRMVDKNPKTRITLEDVLKHEWVTKEGVLPAQAVGEDLGIPGQERVRSTALGKFVAGRRGRDNQLQLVIRHAVRHHTGEGGIAEDTAPSKGTKDAGTGAGNDSTSSNTLNRKSSSGPTIKRHTSSTKRPEQFSLAG
ncbi:unnamed protein product, partial [Pylaiella littoralis]